MVPLAARPQIHQPLGGNLAQEIGIHSFSNSARRFVMSGHKSFLQTQIGVRNPTFIGDIDHRTQTARSLPPSYTTCGDGTLRIVTKLTSHRPQLPA